MPKKFIYKPKKVDLIKPKQKNYNSSKIVKPNTRNKYTITKPKKNQTITRIKPKTNNTKLVKPTTNKYTITKPKKNQNIIRIKPKVRTIVPTKRKTVVKKVLKKQRRPYTGRVDQSLPILKEMSQLGYDMLTFEARNTACPICQGLNGYTFDLKFWLGQLKHQSPIFELSHIQCLDYVRIWDSEGELKPTWINWTGNFTFTQP